MWQRSPYKSIRLHDYRSKTLHGAWTSRRTAYQTVNSQGASSPVQRHESGSPVTDQDGVVTKRDIRTNNCGSLGVVRERASASVAALHRLAAAVQHVGQGAHPPQRQAVVDDTRLRRTVGVGLLRESM